VLNIYTGVCLLKYTRCHVTGCSPSIFVQEFSFDTRKRTTLREPSKMNNNPSTDIQAPAIVANVAESSSDEDEVYSVDEAIVDWLFDKSQATCRNYRVRLLNFRVFLRTRFKRDLDKCKKKHIRAYLTEKGKTAALRPILCVIKSCFKHLHKRNVIAKDCSIGFKLGRQNPCRTERNLKTADIRKMFALSQKKNSPMSHALLQCLTYSGIRITALSKLRRDSVIKTSIEKDGVPIDKYFLRIDNAKGNKHRKVMLKASIGASLYRYAASLSGEWLFPSNRKGFEGKAMHPQAISQRIKRLAKAINQPMISCHWFRHHYATHALAQGASIIDVSKSMGHSNVSITVSRSW